MQRMTGETYQSSDYEKALCAAEAKVGKTCFLTAGLLGVLPWQKYGGVVDRPEHLHIITMDANAAGGIRRFLSETCGAPAEALKFDILNLQDDFRAVHVSQTAYDYTFFTAFYDAIQAVKDATARGGVHAVVVSSLTSLAWGIQRAVGGPLDPSRKGGNMDMAKWDTFAQQIAELRNFAQDDKWHTLWEAHIYKPEGQSQDKDAPAPKETLQIAGKTGKNFANNVEHVYRIRRLVGQKFLTTKCEKVYLDTQPAMDFIPGGRNVTESLDAQEPDIALAFHKLGLKIGRWGFKSKPKK